jgi:hypothetical protein
MLLNLMAYLLISYDFPAMQESREQREDFKRVKVRNYFFLWDIKVTKCNDNDNFIPFTMVISGVTLKMIINND